MRLLATVVLLAAACSSPPAARGVPVFVVPGYGGDAASVETLAAALRADGREVHVVVTPDSGRAPMREGAAALDAAVGRTTPVDVIGFSAGGLVVRTWLAERGGASRARHVVTLGSPNHGSIALRSISDCTGGCADMLPGSALLTRLNAGDETPEGPDYVTFWTADDTAVTPPRSARLDDGLDVRVQDVCPGRHVEHLALVTDPAVVAMAVAAAASGPAATLAC